MGILLRINDFALNSVQTSVLTPTYRVVPMNVLGKLAERLATRFDGEPTVLPMPEDAPPDIPRLIFQSKDQQWKLEMASARINYRWMQRAETQQQSVPEVSHEFLQFLSHFLRIDNPRIGRIALILYRYLLISEPAAIISRHFCRDEWLRTGLVNTKSFELHSHKRVSIGGFAVNSWIRFKTGQLTIPNTPARPIVLVEQDVNTLAEKTDSAAYTMDDLRRFFAAAESEMYNNFKALLEA